MKNILIVCTANKTRSPMAMEIANSIAKKKNAPYFFQSAGVALVGSRIDDNVYDVLKEIGIETTHTPTHISEFNIDRFDSIHVMSERQKVTLCSYYKNKKIENRIVILDVDDPYFQGIEGYRKVRDQFVDFYEKYIEVGEND